MKSFLKTAGVCLLLIALHYTVRPLMGMRISLDFRVVAVLLVAVRVRPGIAALIGFATGLIADSMSPLSFGAGALAMSAIGSAASWLKATVFGDNVLQQVIFLAAGKWAFDILYLVVERRLNLADLAVQLVLWSPLSAIATGVAGALIVMTFGISLESRR
jgi:rod shape-determining protein MreD